MSIQSDALEAATGDQLPPGWRMSKIGELLKVRNGFAFKSADYQEQGALLIRQSNLDSSRVSIEKAKYLPKQYLEEYREFLVKKGDILIGMSGSIGKLCTYDRDEPALQNQRTGLLVFKDPVQKAWVWYYLPLLENDLVTAGKGVAVLNISASQIESFPIPIAPLNQQKHIVEEIEKQFSRLDEAIANLKRVKANLKRYKAAVLKAAVEGRLVETEASIARREGRIYETGEQLLQRILETRRSQWKSKGKYKEPAAPDTADLPKLPEGWVWASLDQLTRDSLIGLDRGRDQQNAEGIGVPYVKMNNVTMEGDVTDVDIVYVDASGEEKRRFSLERDDLLFNTRNSKELVGKVGLVRAIPNDSIYNNNLLRIRLANGSIPSFICSQMRADGFRRRMELVKKATTNVAAVYAKDLFPLQLAFPPEQEQLRIVAEVDRRFSLVSELESQIEDNSRRSERLRQSILTEAFSGQLLRQVGGSKSTMSTVTG